MHEEAAVRHAGLRRHKHNTPTVERPRRGRDTLTEGRTSLCSPALRLSRRCTPAITDEASPFALRSTGNRLSTAVHRGCSQLSNTVLHIAATAALLPHPSKTQLGGARPAGACSSCAPSSLRLDESLARGSWSTRRRQLRQAGERRARCQWRTAQLQPHPTGPVNPTPRPCK
jgi:hypothetical protein